ncbi:hypothetical protein [Dinghuibacter silviterrae]|uniref:Uncharacterized protein n=1 Tax=Dinghuibacter silviterrae TaxID=1539049 RepID=A0A4R8DQA2_9BACT|nr:hypothetical protein [Dinghuibacter silviterrae]TDW99300.1 hypothetical protein EDB95_0309 [Dinghuibacter silviterrae]
MDIHDQQDKRRRLNDQLHAVRDFTMGLLYVAAGLFLFLYRRWGLQIDLISRPIEISLGVIVLVYGIWRIVRGIQKNY